MQVFTTTDVARLLHVDTSTVSRWIDSGKLVASKTPGGHRRITQGELSKFMLAQGIPDAPVTKMKHGGSMSKALTALEEFGKDAHDEGIDAAIAMADRILRAHSAKLAQQVVAALRLLKK